MNAQMITRKFKTNLKCNGCVSKIKPSLDQMHGVISWEIDLQNQDKILTIVSTTEVKKQVVEIVRNAGFKIEEIS